MDHSVIIGGILAVLALLTEVPSLDERKRVLKGKYEFLRARIHDIENSERVMFYDRVQRHKKRKRDSYDLCVWVAEGRELLITAESLLTQAEEQRGFLPSFKKRKVIDRVVSALTVHDNKGDMLCRNVFSQEQGPLHGNHIPVKDLIGQGALNTLEELRHQLQVAEVSRVAIHGRKGIGKTLLMKHLHNCALEWTERFPYVLWVTSPDQFSIKRVQDAVAAVVRCDFDRKDDLNLRAKKLSKKLGELGSFVLFLDGVPKADFSLEQIGIPIPAEGSGCKLVVTTASTTLGCRLLDGFGRIELNRLSETEAFELFMNEANIETRAVTLLGDIPRLLAGKCNGIPRTIVDLASQMCGINDLHEWRNLLHAVKKLEKKTKLPCQVIIDGLEM